MVKGIGFKTMAKHVNNAPVAAKPLRMDAELKVDRIGALSQAAKFPVSLIKIDSSPWPEQGEM